jgi:hypothetical protein
MTNDSRTRQQAIQRDINRLTDELTQAEAPLDFCPAHQHEFYAREVARLKVTLTDLYLDLYTLRGEIDNDTL